MKAIIIARVSTEEQREAGNSLPAPYYALTGLRRASKWLGLNNTKTNLYICEFNK